MDCSIEFLFPGNTLFIQDRFEESIQAFTQAIEEHPDSSEAYTSLSYAYLKSGQFSKSFESGTNAINLNPNLALAHFRTGQAAFYQENFKEALKHFESAENLSPEITRNYIKKCKIELKQVPVEIKQEVYTWYQSQTHIYIVANITTKSPETIQVEFDNQKISVSGTTSKDIEYNLHLNLVNPIVPERSSYEIEAHKVVLTLEKTEAVIWNSLEPDSLNQSRPSYPSSSKKKVDWSEIDKEMEAELKKEKPEGDQALEELFREIYANADEDTRRAMNKSFETSGGTVLSTNWGEVKQKDYEGRDRPDAPQGQQWVSRDN